MKNENGESKMRVHHVAIWVKDAEKSATFYKQNLGFKEINRYKKPGWDSNAIILKLHDFQVEIFQLQIQKRDDLSDLEVIGLKHIGMQVENVKEKYEELKNKNLDIDKPKKGTTCARYCYLKDPNGILIELYEA